ncbi:MAG: hemerythrin domain-containing protein, partial [Chloroflexota bacterium]
MRIIKAIKNDQETIRRFLDVLGGGSVILSSNKLVQPGFFVLGHSFIQEFVEGVFQKKEAHLITALEDGGFPPDGGPIGSLKSDQKKCHDAAEHMLNAAKQWQNGDQVARSEVGWAVSEYTNSCRQRLERIRNLIIPLLEQTFSLEEDQKIAEELNEMVFE